MGRPEHLQRGAPWLPSGECAWLLVLQSLFAPVPPANSALRAGFGCADACRVEISFGGGGGSVSTLLDAHILKKTTATVALLLTIPQKF